jgi:hypothetical protein
MNINIFTYLLYSKKSSIDAQIQIQIQINFIQLCLMIQEHFTTLRTCQNVGYVGQE